MTIDYPHRRFQVWAYSVSFSRLLLRSTKTADFPTRVDVLFQGVEAMSLAEIFEGLLVSEVAEDVDLQTASVRLGVPVESTTFRLAGRDYIGYVAALLVVGHEDAAEFYEPSPLWVELHASS